MSPQFTEYTVTPQGGLTLVDSPEAIPDGVLTVARNVRYYGFGRVGPRRGLSSAVATVGGPVCGIFPFPHGTDASGGDTGCVYLAYESGSSVHIYAALEDGSGVSSDLGALAGYGSGVSSIPRMFAATLGRRLWIHDAFQSKGLTVYDPLLIQNGSTNLYQPVFSFAGGTAKVVKPKCIASFANHLFIAGYGEESDEDRPEIVRFSYLGLDNTNDTTATDAGSGALNESIFAQGDYFAVSPSGIPVMGMIPVAGALLLLTTNQAYIVTGSDRTSFSAVLIDNQRGLVNTAALVEADGIAYWMSPLGPCRFSGGRVEPLERPIRRRLDSINTRYVFAVHDAVSGKVVWQYRPNSTSSGDATEYLAYDYRRSEWDEGDGPGFFTGGNTRAGTGGTFGSSGGGGGGGGGGGENPPPAGDPSGLTTTEITQSAATGNWTNGDSAVDTFTEIQLTTNADTGYASPLVDTEVEADQAESYRFTGLTEDTDYRWRVRHRRNGQYSNWIQTTFSTLAPTDVPTPTGVTVDDDPYYDPIKETTTAGLLVSWNAPPESGLKTEMWYSDDGGAYTLFWTVAEGDTSYRASGPEIVAGTEYCWKLKHKRTSSGDTSIFSDPPVCETPTVGPQP